jgi:phosphoribosylanthranilate isomerase
MTWVKICGITNLEDAQLAIDAGADAVGFVFCEKSPRNITPQAAAKIVRNLPKHVEKVGVFVGPGENELINAVQEAGLTAVQLHFIGENGGFGTRAIAGVNGRFKLYMSLPMATPMEQTARLAMMIPSIANEANILQFDTIFLDSGSAQHPGGTGRAFDWEKALPLVQAMQTKIKVVVAGGLNPENVSEAIAILHPFGVDVATGVEASPGRKDPQKVRAFIHAVRKAESAP